MNNMTCAKCAMEDAERAEAAQQDNTTPSHNEEDNRSNQDNDHNRDAGADHNEDHSAADEQDGEERNGDGDDDNDDDNDDEDDDENGNDRDGSDGKNRWRAAGRPFTSANEAIVQGDGDKNNPASFLWVRPKLFSGKGRRQLGHLINHLNLHKFNQIRRLANKLNLPRQPTQRQILEREQALAVLIAALRSFRELYKEKETGQKGATLHETNRALVACYQSAGYEMTVWMSLYRRMMKIKKLKNETFRSLLPMIDDDRVYDLMLAKLANRLCDEQKKDVTIGTQLVRNYGLDAYHQACREVQKEDADKRNDNSNGKEPAGTGTIGIESVALDDKDKNSTCEIGKEYPRDYQFPHDDSNETHRVPNPASIVRVLEPLFPPEVQEQLAYLAFAFGLHDQNWLDDLLNLDETAINRLTTELFNFCSDTCKDGWGSKTGRALLSCLRKAQSDKACAYLKECLQLEDCKLKRTLYRSFFSMTTVKSLYDDSLKFLDVALRKCKENSVIITVPLLRKLALESHQQAQEVYNEKRRQQDKARKQEELRQQEKRLKTAKAAGKRAAARSKTPPAAPSRKPKGCNVTASNQKKAGAAKSTTTKKKGSAKEENKWNEATRSEHSLQ